MKKVNDWIALHATIVFGTMWTTYAFFLYGFIPLFFPDHMNTFMYWGNTVQLWSLPLLMVGQRVMGRSSEKRAQQDHDALMNANRSLRIELTSQQEEIAELHAIITSQSEILNDLHQIMKKLGVENGSGNS